MIVLGAARFECLNDMLYADDVQIRLLRAVG